MKLKLMTFNTQHCKNYNTNKIDYDSITILIKKYSPDIIGLNEIYGKGFDKKNAPDGQAAKLASELGYYYYFGVATKLWFKPYGNALLSKYPILNAEVIKIPYPLLKRGNMYYERRSIIKATVNVDNNPLTVFISHFGLNGDEQENAFNTMIESLPNNNFIIMGDFNVDYDNSQLTKLYEKASDTSEFFTTRKFTWPSDNPWVKYDYILTSKDIETNYADIPNEIVSDHRPYICEIELNSK